MQITFCNDLGHFNRFWIMLILVEMKQNIEYYEKGFDHDRGGGPASGME